MALEFPLHLTLLVAGAVGTLVGLAVAWPHRRSPAGDCLLLLLLAIGEWQLTGLGALGTQTLEGKRWWAEVQYAGIVAVPPLWLHFVLRYLGDARAHRRAWLTGSAVIPALILVAAATSGHHALLWSGIGLVPAPTGVRAVFHHGPLFWVGSGYSYLVLLAATVLLVRAHRGATAPVADQIRLLIAGGSVPWIANLLYVAGVGAGTGIDPTPLAFGITGICAAVAVADLGLLELSPARLWRSRSR